MLKLTESKTKWIQKLWLNFVHCPFYPSPSFSLSLSPSLIHSGLLSFFFAQTFCGYLHHSILLNQSVFHITNAYVFFSFKISLLLLVAAVVVVWRCCYFFSRFILSLIAFKLWLKLSLIRLICHHQSFLLQNNSVSLR